MRDRIVRLAELAQELTNTDLDNAAQALRWADVREIATDLAAEATVQLERTGIAVAKVPWDDDETPEEIAELAHGWASTPAEVMQWAADAGIDLETGGKVVLTAKFDGKPEDHVRAALRQAGFSYQKTGRRWDHKCFGQFTRSAKVMEARKAA